MAQTHGNGFGEKVQIRSLGNNFKVDAWKRNFKIYCEQECKYILLKKNYFNFIIRFIWIKYQYKIKIIFLFNYLFWSSKTIFVVGTNFYRHKWIILAW